MKKAVITLSILFSGLLAGAQTLEFSQVKIVTLQETVPLGKVWKVESVIYNIPNNQSAYTTSTSSSCSYQYHYNYAVEIAGSTTKVGNGTQPASYSSGDYTHSYTMLPLWLPAGYTLSGGPCSNKVSVIEFTVVP